MTLRQDLKAAKALVDTPKKCTALDIYGAIRGVTNNEADERFEAMQDALRRQLPRANDRLSTFYKGSASHRAVMALFDRAINEAP